MASYKYPRIVEFVPSLPMSATGKILERELAQRSTPLRRAAPRERHVTDQEAAVDEPAGSITET